MRQATLPVSGYRRNNGNCCFTRSVETVKLAGLGRPAIMEYVAFALVIFAFRLQRIIVVVEPDCLHVFAVWAKSNEFRVTIERRIFTFFHRLIFPQFEQ
jgi:hypothetical protein